MRRWTFHITSALSLLLLLAMVGLWVDSAGHFGGLGYFLSADRHIGVAYDETGVLIGYPIRQLMPICAK